MPQDIEAKLLTQPAMLDKQPRDIKKWLLEEGISYYTAARDPDGRRWLAFCQWRTRAKNKKKLSVIPAGMANTAGGLTAYAEDHAFELLLGAGTALFAQNDDAQLEDLT